MKAEWVGRKFSFEKKSVLSHLNASVELDSFHKSPLKIYPFNQSYEYS